MSICDWFGGAEMTHALKSHSPDPVIHKLRRATINEYSKFVAAYIRRGGTSFMYHDYPFDRFEVLIATHKDVEIPRACGASALNVIEPVGVSCRFIDNGEYNHGNIYRMDGTFECDHPSIFGALLSRDVIDAVMKNNKDISFEMVVRAYVNENYR